MNTDRLLPVATLAGYAAATALLLTGRRTLSLVALGAATLLGAAVAYRTLEERDGRLP
ncbi:hypothetical protein [Halobaculum sp. MBLA0143]|uniref:hypothetical protein n=1 Tax=Halobaculum sp. MBLA0143 TaxID=3079933 RepID=UPI003525BB3E